MHLPHIEDGTITFIGATTENPSFELTRHRTVLSRARVYSLKSLSTEDIEQVLTQAMEDKPVAMVVRILFCQMKHDAPLLNW